jgi:hypothetical protein
MPYQDLAVGGTSYGYAGTNNPTPTLTFGSSAPVTPALPTSTDLSFGSNAPSMGGTIGNIWGNVSDFVLGTPTASDPRPVPQNVLDIYGQYADTMQAGGMVTPVVSTAQVDGQTSYVNTLTGQVQSVLAAIGSAGDAVGGTTQAAYTQNGVAVDSKGLSVAVIAAVLAVGGLIYFASQKG